MKKLTSLATVATLLMAGAAFAAGSRHLVVQPNGSPAGVQGSYSLNPVLLTTTPGAASGPTTTANDDTCDIAVVPAATLLLPYFEVDYKSPQTTATTTLFTITNVSDVPQIAKVTIWTDYSFPVLDFNIFLTGYGQQGINLYDIIARGTIAGSGTSITQTPGPLSVDSKFSTARGPGGYGTGGTNTNFNPHFLTTAYQTCQNLPGAIPAQLLADVQTGLTLGTTVGCGSSRVGAVHSNAIGYVTVDVVADCTTTLPTSGTYYSSQILFDNVLIGDYAQLSPNPATTNAAGGTNMVHIRAIPEGGGAGSTPTAVGGAYTNLTSTFYSRYTPYVPGGITPQQVFSDRRQPLPSTFAARYIQGGPNGFNTNYKIWREGLEVAGANTGFGVTSCARAFVNANIPLGEIVRFDEHENPFTYNPGVIISPGINVTNTLPETSSTPTTSGTFPQFPGGPGAAAPSGDVAGWMYLNLNSGETPTVLFPPRGTTNTQIHPNFPGSRASQNWVIVNLQAQTRFSLEFSAPYLGNGCNPVTPLTAASGGNIPIGPAGGVLICPSGFTSGLDPSGSYGGVTLNTPCIPGTQLFTGGNGTP